MGLARALVSSCRLSIATVPPSVTVLPQLFANFYCEFQFSNRFPKSLLPMGSGPLTNTMLHWTASALSRCMSVTDVQTDYAMVTYVAVGGIAATEQRAFDFMTTVLQVITHIVQK